MPRLRADPAPPSRFVLSWDAATRATDAIARLTITVLITAGIAAHAVVFLAVPVGILYDIRRTVAKSMDVARATVAHSRATVKATGCHPTLPPVGSHAAASAYVASIAANAATSESVINRTEAGLLGLFGDGFTAAVAALTPTHWGMCVDKAIEMADSERVMWLPIGGEMVATAIGRTLAAGVAALGPVTTLAASMAASFWIFPSLSASALMLSGVGLAWRLSKTVDRWTGGGGESEAGNRGVGGFLRGVRTRAREPVEWEDAGFADTRRRRRGRERRAVRRRAEEDSASADGSTGVDDCPRSSDGARSLHRAASAAAVPATPTVAWGWKLITRMLETRRQSRHPDDEEGVRPSVGGGKNTAGGRLDSPDDKPSESGGDGSGYCGGRHGRTRMAAVPLGRGDANSGGSGRHRDAIVASHGEELRPVAGERWDVTDDNTDGDIYDDEWDDYGEGDATADDADYRAVDDDDDDDDETDVGNDDEYAADDYDDPADGDDWDNSRDWEAQRPGDDLDECGEREAQHPADRGAANWRRRPAGGLDHHRCTDDDAGAIPSDGEAVGTDPRRRRPRRAASPPPLRAPTPPLPPPTVPPKVPPTVPRAAVAPRRTSRRRVASRR